MYIFHRARSVCVANGSMATPTDSFYNLNRLPVTSLLQDRFTKLQLKNAATLLVMVWTFKLIPVIMGACMTKREQPNRSKYQSFNHSNTDSNIYYFFHLNGF